MKDKEQEQPYINEHGKLVFGDVLCYTDYFLGPLELSLDNGKYRVYRNSHVRLSTDPQVHAPVSGRTPSSSSRKRDLLHRYSAIVSCHARSDGDEISWTQTFNRHRFRPPQYQQNLRQNALYAPGSVLSNPLYICAPYAPRVPSTLVGRVRPWSHEWKWDASLTKGPLEKAVNLSFDKFVVQSINC